MSNFGRPRCKRPGCKNFLPPLKRKYCCEACALKASQARVKARDLEANLAPPKQLAVAARQLGLTPTELVNYVKSLEAQLRGYELKFAQLRESRRRA